MKGRVLYKMTGSGNDFVFVDGRVTPLACWSSEDIRRLCARPAGIGADGFVVLELGSTSGAIRFHFFNSDGARAAMCGNAALCATRLAGWLRMVSAPEVILETDAGPLLCRCLPGPGEKAEIEVPPTSDVVEPPVSLAPGERSAALTEVGVPHLVVLVESLREVRVQQRGRELRFHELLQPDGANVNFVARESVEWSMRTFERGVEDETLACGTGAVAAAAVLARAGAIDLPWSVRTASGDTLTVSGELGNGGQLSHPRLAGEGRLMFRAVLGTLESSAGIGSS